MRTDLFVDWARHASHVAFAIGLTAFSACSDHSKMPILSVKQSVVVTNGVRAFAADVAGGGTRGGAPGRARHLRESPGLFLARSGRAPLSARGGPRPPPHRTD